MKSNAALKQIIDTHSVNLATRLQPVIARQVRSELAEYFKNFDFAAPANVHPLKGRKKTKAQMRCKAPGCKEQSRGPRFHYLCRKHEK